MSAKIQEASRLDRHDWIQSYSGLKVHPLELRPEQVKVGDIAHALSMKTRFTGHTSKFYSVAEHCYRGSFLVPRSYQLAFLLHDSTEAYLPDIAAPIKSAVRVLVNGGLVYFKDLEGMHADVIFEALGIRPLRPLVESEVVKLADLQMLAWEFRDLMGTPPEPWGLTIEAPSSETLEPFTQTQAKSFWLQRFNELTGK